MASASLLKSSVVVDKSEFVKGQCFNFFYVMSSLKPLKRLHHQVWNSGYGRVKCYPCGKTLASIGLENTEANRQVYRILLVAAPGLGQYISGAILFEETFYQSTTDG
ncbi:fructose-bisphosphate aldolase, chloroplastic-like [Solanum lycopersicum]|uniref:fructose-bisphosphate aldolase, chloroplastic-like n=1 Tax=Solanum lycopersicum TaxID=4081 RepID=UPI000276A9F9